jgi:hypothetical protein
MYVPVDGSQTQDASGVDVEVVPQRRRRGCWHTCIMVSFTFLAGVLLSMVLMVLLRAWLRMDKDLGKLKPYIKRMST